MTENQWKCFEKYKNEIKKICSEVEKQDFFSKIKQIQNDIIKSGTRQYDLENSFVYNTAYDDILKTDDIKLIVIGDNPGWEEQLNKNRKYLVGQSGRLATGFFSKHEELEIDFRKNVVITNKVPVHTPKTTDLKKLNLGSDSLNEYLIWVQKQMACITADLHQGLINNKNPEENAVQLWMVGYSELKPKKIFSVYRDEFKACYAGKNQVYWDNVFVYQHFSMNRFSIDLSDYIKSKSFDCSLNKSLYELGHKHRDEIFL